MNIQGHFKLELESAYCRDAVLYVFRQVQLL